MQYPQYSTNTPVIHKPGKVDAIAIMTLVNGIFNILGGLGMTMGVVFGTLFVGIVCAPVTLAPVVLGIFEIIYASKLMSSNPQPPIKPGTAIAICEICAVIAGMFISLAVGIVALVFYNDPEVKYYFDQLNAGGSVPPAPPTQPEQPVAES